MKVTAETLSKAKAMLKVQIPDAVLQGLLEKIPNEEVMPMALGVMEQAIAEVPAGTPAEQAVGLVMQKMQKLSASKRADAPGNPRQFTRQYFDNIWLEQRLLSAELPDTSMELFGERFSTPIMTAALSHLNIHGAAQENAMAAFADGARQAGAVHWVGMCEDEEYERIAETGARIVRIIKPYADEDKIFRQIRKAEETGALAVGMDIDHMFTESGNLDVVRGEAMGLKSMDMLRRYIDATSLPFIIKGVLSVKDALSCAEIGAKGIVVSHHNGHLWFLVPPLMVLPEISKAVGSQMEVFVDCGISSGADAYKAMALGAKAVSVGSHLIPSLNKGGSAGVADRLREMTAELKGFMANTGVADTKSFDPTVLHVLK